MDYFHCAEHIHQVSRRQYGEGTQKCLEWVESTLTRLFYAEVDNVIWGLQRMKPGNDLAKEEIRKLIGYLDNNRQHGLSLSECAVRKPTFIQTALGVYPSSVGTSLRYPLEWPIWMVPLSSTIWPLVSHRPWQKKWSAKDHNTHGVHRMRMATPSRVETPTGCTCRQTFLSKTSGQPLCMTTRRAKWSKRISNSQASAVRTRTCSLTRMVRSMSTSAQRLRKAKQTTGFRPFPARGGSCFFGCTDRLSPGSTRLGSQETSSWLSKLKPEQN